MGVHVLRTSVESSPTTSDREEPGAQWELESSVALESMP